MAQVKVTADQIDQTGLDISTMSGTLGLTHGGTGQVTANASLNALLPSQTGNNTKVLQTDGTNTSWQTAAGSGTVTSVGMSVPSFLSVSGSPVTTTGTLAVTLSGTALPVANGGTGQTTATAAFDGLAPSQTGNSGKYLTTNGTTVSWGTVSASPGGSNTQVQYNNSSAFGGASRTTIDASGNLNLSDATTFTTPSSSSVVGSSSFAGRSMPVNVDSNAIIYPSMPINVRKRIAMATPLGNAGTTVNTFGLTATTTGTATGRTQTFTGDWYQSVTRIGYVTAASTNVGATWSVNPSAPFVGVSSTANKGGFFFMIRFAATFPSSDNTAARCFYGMSDSLSQFVSTDPSSSTSTKFFGVGADTGDTNMAFFHNDGTGGTVSKTTLGASFPKAAQTDPDMYELILYVPQGSLTFGYSLTNIRTGATASSTGITSNCPPTNTQMACGVMRSTAGTATAVAIDLVNAYMETYY